MGASSGVERRSCDRKAFIQASSGRMPWRARAQRVLPKCWGWNPCGREGGRVSTIHNYKIWETYEELNCGVCLCMIRTCGLPIPAYIPSFPHYHTWYEPESLV